MTSDPAGADPIYEKQLMRLRDRILRRWWLINGILWLTVAPLSLWPLRHDFKLLQEHFTWAAVRYALAYNRLSAIGIALCIGLTVALLIAESRHILFGMTSGERQRLGKMLNRIRQQGESHPLWQQICGKSPL